MRTAGVKHMVILVNKMDDPTVEWSEERYKEIQEAEPIPQEEVRLCSADVKYIPCSGLSGAFLKDRPSEEVCSWYK